MADTIETTREERELSAIHHVGANYKQHQDVVRFVEDTEEDNRPMLYHMREDANLLAKYRTENIDVLVSRAVLKICSEHEIDIDGLERKLDVMKKCGDETTHHARMIKAVLKLYLGKNYGTT